jgi:hypothetical protein
MLERGFLTSALLVPGLVLTLSSCSEPQAAGATPNGGEGAMPSTEWRVDPAPILQIGESDGDDAYLFQDIVSVVMLGNGNIAVLDAGPAQLRFYDSSGRHIRTTGGKGSGPGEYRVPARVYHPHADTLLVFDSGLRMETTVDTGGKFVRAVRFEPPATQPFPRDTWLWRRTLVDGPSGIEDRGQLAYALERVPEVQAADSFRFVKVDTFSRLWTRTEPHDPDQPSTWHVFSLAGEPLAVVRTPARFQLQAIGEDRIAGRGWDELGVERVQVFAYDAPAPLWDDRARGTAAITSGDAMPEEIRNGMRGLLRQAMSQQEIFYSKDYSYASSADQLPWPDDMEGYTVHIMGSGPRGYTMLIFHASAPGTCGVTTGMGGPVGWTPGVVLCN